MTLTKFNLHTGLDLKNSDRGSISFFIWLGLIFVLGTTLRSYMIADQIILDDEWHGITYVIGKPIAHLFTPSVAATCVPLNLYRYFLLKTFGWSELLLRLPSLAAGILSLAIFPLLMKSIFSRNTIVVFAFLHAISPFMVFYSRYSRSYSVVVFLCFICIVSLYLWTTSGKRRYMLTYIATGVFAVWFHLLAIPAVFAPLAYIYIAKLKNRWTNSSSQQIQISPSLRALNLATIAILVLLAVLVLPPYLNSPSGFPTERTPISLKPLIGFAQMVSGTTNRMLVFLFCGLILFGQISLLRKKPLFGKICLATAISYFALLIVSKPDCINIPLVFSRYAIPLFPVSFILIAAAIDSLQKLFVSRLTKRRSYGFLFTNLVVGGFIAALFFSGPLTKVYARENSFTNHSAFQESYDRLTWEKSYDSDIAPGHVIKKEEVSPFYLWLANQTSVNSIIEYPMQQSDHNNLYYYYQHFHRKHVLIGYYTAYCNPRYSVKIANSGYFATDVADIDSSLSIFPPGKLFFRNIINIGNIERLKDSSADYIVLHRKIWAVEIHELSHDGLTPIYKGCLEVDYLPTIHLEKFFRTHFGKPVYNDNKIIVFMIR